MTGEPRGFSGVTAGFSSYDGEFTVPKDLRHLRACLLCSLVKVSVGDLVVLADGRPIWGKEGGTDVREQ